MISVLGDENFDARILVGLARRLPSLDAVHAHVLGIRGFADPDLLQYASEVDRIVLTHDRRTMIDFAYERIASGAPFTGVICVPDGFGVGRAIEGLELLLSVSRDDELKSQVRLLPLSY